MQPTNELSKIAIQPILREHLPAAERLFYGYPFKDFQLHQLDISKSIMASFLRESIENNELDSCGFWEEAELVGLLSARHLPWISKQLGANMYTLQHMLSKPKGSEFYYTMLSYITGQINELDFLNCRVATGDVDAIQALESFGFRFVGNEVYLVRSFMKNPLSEDDYLTNCIDCKPAMQKDVVSLAKRIHVHNRYMYDPNIPRQHASKIYSDYITKYAFGQDYRSVVKFVDGKLVGFLFYKFNRPLSEKVGNKYASLDFIGVDPEAQNQGIGEQLNRAALLDLAKADATHVVVRTFGNNYPAIRICQKVGFQITASDVHFHLWLRPKAKLDESVTDPPVVNLRSLG
jgi:ribosomal protein S18 acetylase RimI-like enzyme